MPEGCHCERCQPVDQHRCKTPFGVTHALGHPRRLGWEKHQQYSRAAHQTEAQYQDQIAWLSYRHLLCHKVDHEDVGQVELVKRYHQGCYLINFDVPSSDIIKFEHPAWDAEYNDTELTDVSTSERSFRCTGSSPAEKIITGRIQFDYINEDATFKARAVWNFYGTIMVETMHRLSFGQNITAFDVHLLHNMVAYLHAWEQDFFDNDRKEILLGESFLEPPVYATCCEVAELRLGLVWDEAFHSIRNALRIASYVGFRRCDSLYYAPTDIVYTVNPQTRAIEQRQAEMEEIVQFLEHGDVLEKPYPERSKAWTLCGLHVECKDWNNHFVSLSEAQTAEKTVVSRTWGPVE